MLQKVNPTYVGSDDEVKRWRRVLERSWRGRRRRRRAF